MSPARILRGEIYYVDLNPARGHEMRKTRPAVVVSNDIINDHASVVIVCPLTGAKDRTSPIHILIPKGEAGLKKDSIAHCGQVRAIDKTRLVSKLGQLSANKLEEINVGLRVALSL
jgi:mRNA interferase MazF